MRTANKYDELGTHAVVLIKIKAREIVQLDGFRSHEREDIEQDLALEVIRRLAFFNPARGSREAFVANVIAHKFTDLVTKRWSESRAPMRRECSLNAMAFDETSTDANEEFGNGVEDPSSLHDAIATDGPPEDLRLDLEMVMQSLTPDLRDIVEMLAEGRPHKEVYTLLGISRRSYWRSLTKVRTRFQRAGLHQYLGRKRGTDS